MIDYTHPQDVTPEGTRRQATLRAARGRTRVSLRKASVDQLVAQWGVEQARERREVIARTRPVAELNPFPAPTAMNIPGTPLLRTS